MWTDKLKSQIHSVSPTILTFAFDCLPIFKVLLTELEFQITEARKISVIDAAVAVRKLRYGALRSFNDYALVLQASLLHAKHIGLIKDKFYRNAVSVSFKYPSNCARKFLGAERYHTIIFLFQVFRSSESDS